MGESWTSKHTSLPAGFTLILRGVFRDPGRTVQLSVDRAFELPELSCEKHDAGIFAHMAYSITHHHHGHALIVTNDTDIFMMSVYFITQLDDLHELWVKQMNNYSPVHAITDDLAVKYAVEPADITYILLSTYILTISYIYRRWKRRAYKATIDRLQRTSTPTEIWK